MGWKQQTLYSSVHPCPLCEIYSYNRQPHRLNLGLIHHLCYLVMNSDIIRVTRLGTAGWYTVITSDVLRYLYCFSSFKTFNKSICLIKATKSNQVKVLYKLHYRTAIFIHISYQSMIVFTINLYKVHLSYTKGPTFVTSHALCTYNFA